jgi:hypothetical protein
VQAYQILVLLYSAFLCHLVPSAPPNLTQVFCSQLKAVMHSQSLGCGAWSSAVTTLCASVLISDRAAELLDVAIENVIDKSIELNSDEWRGIKLQLLDFFLNNELCEGRLQGLWKIRLGVVVEEGSIP